MLLANLIILKMVDFQPAPATQLTNEKQIEKKTPNIIINTRHLILITSAVIS